MQKLFRRYPIHLLHYRHYSIPMFPSVRVLLLEYPNIDLSQIKPSGKGGRHTKYDIIQYLKAPPKPKVMMRKRSGHTDVSLSNTTKSMADIWLMSKQEIPHFYMTQDIVIDPWLKSGFSLDNILIRAAIRALRDNPNLNIVKGEDGRYTKSSTVDVTVQLDESSNIILKNADRLEIDQQLLSNKKSLTDEKVVGALCIEKLTSVSSGRSIVRAPHTIVLSYGEPKHRIIVNDNEETILQTTLCVTMSCDNLVIDGMDAAKFLNQLKTILEIKCTN